MQQAIPLSVPELSGSEWRYVKECLDSGWVSSVGPFVDRFEAAVAGYVGSRHAIAAVNGTAALHVALLVAGIKPDDEVLTSTLTFIAPANAIRYVGAWPIFIDAEPSYWQIDVEKVRDFITKECTWSKKILKNKKTGRRVKAILPVHILGHPCDMSALIEIARTYDLLVIEDASESLGATYRESMVGTFGDVAILSFNGNKIITTGGGGMIITNNNEWAGRARYLTTQAKDDPAEYIHNEIGYNYRLSNIHAALGCAQLERIDDFVSKKRRIAATYTRTLGAIKGITPPAQAEWSESTYWMYTVRVDARKYGENSRTLLGRFGKHGIETRPLWQPIHLSTAHAGSQAYHCDVAEKLYRECLSLPCSVGLTKQQQDYVIRVLRSLRK